VREGLLGGSDPEVGSSSCGIIERSFEVCLTMAHCQQSGTPLFVVDLDQGTSVRGHSRRIDRAPFTSGRPRLADILRVGRHVSKVPIREVAVFSTGEVSQRPSMAQVHRPRYSEEPVQF
jgi:hypothetical protein